MWNRWTTWVWLKNNPVERIPSLIIVSYHEFISDNFGRKAESWITIWPKSDEDKHFTNVAAKFLKPNVQAYGPSLPCITNQVHRHWWLIRKTPLILSKVTTGMMPCETRTLSKRISASGYFLATLATAFFAASSRSFADVMGSPLSLRIRWASWTFVPEK